MFDLSQVHQDASGNVLTGNGSTVASNALSKEGYAAALAYAKSTPDPSKDTAYNSSLLPQRSAPAPRVNPETVGAADAAGSAQNSFQDFRNSNALTPEEIAKTNDEYTARAKDMTDLIDADFAKRTATQTDTNNAEIARTRVLNAKTGNTGSGTGAEAIDTTTKKGNDVLTALDQAHTAAVEAALGQIDGLKQAQLNEETTKKQNDLTAYNNLRTTNAKTAETTLEALAKGGADLYALKNDKADPNDPNEPSSYDALSKALSLSPLELDTKFNSLKLAAHQVNYTYVTDKDGYTYGYGIDPTTKQMVETPKEKIEGLQPGDTLTTTKTGDLVIKTNTGAYKPITSPTSPTGTFTKFSASQVSKLTGYGFPQDSISKLEGYLKGGGTVDDAIAKIKATNKDFTDAQANELKAVLTGTTSSNNSSGGGA